MGNVFHSMWRHNPVGLPCIQYNLTLPKLGENQTHEKPIVFNLFPNKEKGGSVIARHYEVNFWSIIIFFFLPLEYFVKILISFFRFAFQIFALAIRHATVSVPQIGVSFSRSTVPFIWISYSTHSKPLRSWF